ncbi:integrin alpha n-terminal [Fusarium heterosporum]|uniref:Integrin alpha n-terminal n=1 Tax=Fusarium heterosporum TaxID=42747 RepID=A0A8H5T1I3_FUSHE|nr:integrin alpha n-terminal [Fusarium heterosporum]
MHVNSVLHLVTPALAFIGGVAGVPSGQYSSYEANFVDTTLSPRHASLHARQGTRPALRILPLGASIVSGVGSSTGNGFRKPLRDQLRYKGWNVNMVGSKQNGDMVDRDFEATSGDVIDQVRKAGRNSYGYKPNVVIMNVGTNDANNNLVNGASSRMEGLLDDLWGSDGMSNTYVVVSSVIRRNNAQAEQNRKEINEQYKKMVKRLQSIGKRIEYVDIDIPLNELVSDGIHPNDAGHKRMAIKFWHAIEWGYQSGRIGEAAPFTIAATNTCDKQPGQAQYGGITQKGSGDSDGIYYHDSQEMGTIWSYTSEFDRDQWFFTRLYGSKYDDIVGWWYANEKLSFATWKNNGGGKFSKVSDLDTKLFCNVGGVWWVDINNDGYDDFLCVSPNGDTLASINNRDGTATSPPTFKKIGMIKGNVGFKQDRVRWGDIDGDGRADYMIVDDAGNVQAWRNSGTSDTPSWQALGLRFTAKGMGDQRGVRFEDINGDGRDDWLWVDNKGATTTWTNSRSCKKGKPGDGLNVAWRQGFWKGASSGPTHAGVGADSRNRIHFARIYGEAAFGLLPKADYVYLQSTKQSDGKFKFDMKVWKNTGGGSTKLKADGNKYCNMLGHDDGRQDYVWTLSTGKMTVWPNLGKKSVSGDNDVFWGSPKDLWSPGRDLDRRDLHLVDWNNDGACDIAWVDPNNNNKVSVWLNNYKKTGAFTWTYLADPAPQLNCPEKRGVGIHDLAVRFADISDNKLSDYICLQPDGRFHGWTHNSDGSWERIAQFKKAEGIDRANIRFGNVNGKGGEDMIWVDKYTGDATVFINRGKMDTGGSNWWFLKSGKQYAGSWAGTCQYFPDLDGDGRADLHSIMATFDNRGETFFNRCGLTDRTGDDAGWAPGQDPGFGDLPASNPSAGNGGVPSLPSTCETFCWDVISDKEAQCKDDGTEWDMDNRDDDIADASLDITSLAAIGDSYSAGIGAGDRLGSVYDAFKSGTGKSPLFETLLKGHVSNLATTDFACARYDHAYPYILNQDSTIGDPSKRKFQFLSCSGAVMKDVLEKQIPNLDGDQDAITLSIGGNDIGLISLLNSCIFQMGVFTKAQAAIAKLAAEVDKKYTWAKDFDWESLSRGCEGQIQYSVSLAASDTFAKGLDDVLSAAKKKLNKQGRIYVTGYAKFFAEDMTSECDKVTWTTWIYKLANMGQPAEYLTVARRFALNSLVDRVNAQIEAAVERAGASVKFVSYDLYAGKYGGRYCEKGVDESTSESNTRKELMFYELNSWDPAGTTPWKRDSDGGELSGTFYGDMLILSQITKLVDPDAELHHDNGNSRKRDLSARADIVDYLVPNGYARVFHPQINLHRMIANLVIYEMMVDFQIRNGYAEWSDKSDQRSCKIEDNPTNPPSGGNSVEKKWSMEFYAYPEESCDKTDKRHRLLWGSKLNTCYNFMDDMPDTDCKEWVGDKEQGGCVGGHLKQASVRVPDEGYNCMFYNDNDCKGDTYNKGGHSCMKTGDTEGWIGVTIASFRCLQETK